MRHNSYPKWYASQNSHPWNFILKIISQIIKKFWWLINQKIVSNFTIVVRWTTQWLSDEKKLIGINARMLWWFVIH